MPSASELPGPILCLFARPGLADLQLASSPLTHLLCNHQASFFLLLNRILHLQTAVQRNPTISNGHRDHMPGLSTDVVLSPLSV